MLHAKKSSKGFTLIEIVLTFALLGVCLAPFSILVFNVVKSNIYSQALATAVSLAEGEMERVTNTRFSVVADEASAAFSAPFAAYTHEVAVDYVNAGALGTPVAGPTNYKRVQINIANSISGTITLTTVAANITNQ